MVDENWRDRIVVDPGIHHGKPCVRGTRVAVSVVVGSLGEGDGVEDIVAAYPQLSEEDVRACIKFAAEAVNDSDFVPLGSSD